MELVEPEVVPDATEKIMYRECLELLAGQTIGRIAVVADGRIGIFPVNYGLDGDGIVFRTNAGTKTRGALAGEVAFEVDSIDPTERTGWSVVVHGSAEDITHFDSQQLVDRVHDSWAGPKERLFRITPETITGRRVGGGAPAP